MSARQKYINLLRKLNTTRDPEVYDRARGEFFQYSLDTPGPIAWDRFIRQDVISIARQCFGVQDVGTQPVPCSNDVKQLAERVLTMVRDEIPQRADYMGVGGRRRRKTRRSRKNKKTRKQRK